MHLYNRLFYKTSCYSKHTIHWNSLIHIDSFMHYTSAPRRVRLNIYATLYRVHWTLDWLVLVTYWFTCTCIIVCFTKRRVTVNIHGIWIVSVFKLLEIKSSFIGCLRYHSGVRRWWGCALRQVGGCLRVLRFPPRIKLTATI
jgi:hypothetical protein